MHIAKTNGGIPRFSQFLRPLDTCSTIVFTIYATHSFNIHRRPENEQILQVAHVPAFIS